MSRKVLFDTDIGSDVDDAIALAFALACPDDLDLVAVTTVSANTRGRAEAAARILGVAGRSDVEVCVGAEGALVRRDRFVWRDIETEGYPEGPDAPISDEPAPERIVRAARENEGLELVAIGPLTNVAHALALDPELPKRVARLTVMGGHIREVRVGALLAKPGIDYNLCSDPEASVMVLGAGFETRLVTADVTLQTWMREQDVVRLEAAAHPLPRGIANLVRQWTPWQRKIFTGIGGTLADDNVAFLHDPLTLLSLVDPSPLSFERLRIVTAEQRGVLRTFEMPEAGPGTPSEVATAVDAEAARDAIVTRLLSF
jgi:purine nucleosidase